MPAVRKLNPQGAPSAATAVDHDAPEADPFRYGWRELAFRGADGKETWRRIPLTLEDILHPQEEDFRVHTDAHNEDCRYLKSVLKARLRGRADVRVLSDHRIAWDSLGRFAHGPDIAVLAGIARDRHLPGTVNLYDETQARVLLYLEVSSPATRVVDFDSKIREYHDVGVPLYIIVDRDRKTDRIREIIGWRAGESNYIRIKPDARGRIRLPAPLRLWIGHENDRAVCWDAVTGEKLRDYDEEVAARQAAESRALAEAASRQAAESKAATEAAARQVAESRAVEAERRLRELEARLAGTTSPARADDPPAVPPTDRADRADRIVGRAARKAPAPRRSPSARRR